MDHDNNGWIVGLVGIGVAVVREVWGALRRDEITYLKLAVKDLQDENALCKARCEELHDDFMVVVKDVMPLLERLHEVESPPKRRRKAQG